MRIYLFLYLFIFSCQLCQAQPSSKQTKAISDLQNELMQKIIKYLEKNIGNRLVMGEVSKRFAISERSLSRLFRSTLQISFLQYVKTLRMVTAIELIMKTSKPISEIAYSVGYSAVGPFSDAFCDFTLSRPSDFRKNILPERGHSRK